MESSPLQQMRGNAKRGDFVRRSDLSGARYLSQLIDFSLSSASHHRAGGCSADPEISAAKVASGGGASVPERRQDATILSLPFISRYLCQAWDLPAEMAAGEIPGGQGWMPPAQDGTVPIIGLTQSHRRPTRSR